MSKRYLIIVTESQGEVLGQRLAVGTAPARELTQAGILLKADDGPHGPGWTDAAIARALM